MNIDMDHMMKESAIHLMAADLNGYSFPQLMVCAASLP